MQSSRWGEKMFLLSCALALSFPVFASIDYMTSPGWSWNENWHLYVLIALLVVMYFTWSGKAWAMAVSICLFLIAAIALAVVGYLRGAEIGIFFAVLNFVAAIVMFMPPVQQFIADQRAYRSQSRPESSIFLEDENSDPPVR